MAKILVALTLALIGTLVTASSLKPQNAVTKKEFKKLPILHNLTRKESPRGIEHLKPQSAVTKQEFMKLPSWNNLTGKEISQGLKLSNNPAVLTAHVDFQGIKRSVVFEKGDDALKLRYFIMVAFADVGLDKLPPAHVELLKYDEGVRDYVPLPLDTILEENVKVKVELKGNKGPLQYHRVKNKTTYRLWNPTTASLLQRNSNNIFSCDGSFKDMDYDTVAKTNGSTTSGFAFYFEDKASSKIYVLNATNGGNTIEAVEFKANNEEESPMKFIPSYYWSFTVFENDHYRNSYLGCEKDGRSLLVSMNSRNYPDPRALFITNTYKRV